MPPTKVEIAVVVSTVPVGPRQTDLKQQPFAVHLSAAFKPSALVPTLELKKVLRPWLSNWSFDRALVKVVDKAGKITDLPGKRIDSPLREPESISEALTILQGKIAGDNRIETWNPSSLGDVKNGNQQKEPSLIEAVHASSLYPGRIPQESKLLNYFSTDGWPAEPVRLVAAPEFSFMFKKDDGSSATLTCRLKAGFKIDDWPTGWDYDISQDGGTTINPVVGDFEFKVSAYSKPATIAKTGNTFFFDEENLAGGADLGPNFGDYWFRSRKADSWTSRIEDLKQFTLNLNERMMQARSGLDQSDAALLEAWDDLQLMTLALYGQWGSAIPVAGCMIERSDDKRLIELLTTALTLTADEVTKLGARLALFRTKLTETFDPTNPGKNQQQREARRLLWLKVFQEAFKDSTLTTQTVLQRASDSALDFELVLFYQWNLAIIWDLNLNTAFDPATDSLSRKWIDAFGRDFENWQKNKTSTTLPPAPLALFIESVADPDQGKMNYGVRTLVKRYWLCVSQDLLATPDAASARKTIAIQLKALVNRIDIALSTQFVPQLVSEKLIGADKWQTLWKKWLGDGVNDEGYVERFLKLIVLPPEVEDKPGGLSLVFDKPAAKSEQSPKVEVSAWRKLAGVGVVVREKKIDPKEGWHLATAATVSLRGVHVLRVTKIEKRKIELSVDIYPQAREGLYQLSIGNETFNGVFAVGQGSVTAGAIVVSPNTLPKGSSAAVLTVTRTDKDFDDAALGRVNFDRLLKDTSLVPMRVPFRNGVRNPRVTYNQRSLIASSHLNNAVRGDFETRDGVQNGFDALYEYTPAQNGNPTFNLLPLKFGKAYQMASFMVDTAGGLPAELSDTAPWKFKSSEFTVSQTPGVISDFFYQRRVPVGQLRVSHVSATGTPQPLNWPEWPQNISPLAGETILNNKKDPKDKPDDPEKRRRQTPLVLVYGTGANRTFVFGIKPPTCDLDVLERWENTSDAATKERLAQTFKQYFARLAKRKDNSIPSGQSGVDEDASFDDPAVTQFLFILESYDFEELDETKKWKVESFCTSEITRDPALKDIRYYQKDWKKVSCQGGDKFEVAPSGDIIQVTVRNTEASVARLKSFALVPSTSAGADQKFAQDFFEAESPDPLEVLKFAEDFSVYQYQTPALKQGIEAVRQQFKCLKSFSVLIETPNADMPEARDLWRSLVLRTSGPARDTIEVSLQPPANLRPRFRNIIGCDLLKQNWRWQGRPADHESIKNLQDVWTAADGIVQDKYLTEVTCWEVSAFAEMHDVFDTLTIPLTYNFKSDAPLFVDKFVQNPLAQYLRYGVRANSRYAGLFPNQETTVTGKQPYDKPFQANDLLHLKEFVAKLKGADPLAQFLRTQLQPDTLQLINDPAPDEHNLLTFLARDFKFLIEGPSIYAPQRFPEAQLSPETIALRNQQPVGEGQSRLNRWLLEDAFRIEIQQSRNVVSGVGWRRALLRYRGSKPTKPLIKAIVPLTQADPLGNQNGAAAPLMVALEETMFNHCGITEWIQCKIEKVKLYTAASAVVCATGTRRTLHQAGHDPILTPDNAVCDLPDAEKSTLTLEPVGPFGHTFDTGARQSLFSTSSFLLRPYPEAIEWDFAKVSFRRMTGNEVQNDFGEATDWTVPVWLYFLPSSSFKIADWNRGLSITWDSTTKKLGLTPADPADQGIFKDLKKREMFKYCLLLTRPVRDFRGQSEYEVYDRYIRLEYSADATSLQKVVAEALQPNTEYIARLVEVQVIRDTPSTPFAELPETGKEFWNGLFGIDDPAQPDAPFRITRVSPPKRLGTGP